MALIVAQRRANRVNAFRTERKKDAAAELRYKAMDKDNYFDGLVGHLYYQTVTTHSWTHTEFRSGDLVYLRINATNPENIRYHYSKIINFDNLDGRLAHDLWKRNHLQMEMIRLMRSGRRSIIVALEIRWTEVDFRCTALRQKLGWHGKHVPGVDYDALKNVYREPQYRNWGGIIPPHLL